MTLVQVKTRLHELGFSGMLPRLEVVIDRVQKGELHVIEGLDELFESEWRYRQERATARRATRQLAGLYFGGRPF